MDAPVRAPTDGGNLLERLLDEAEQSMTAGAVSPTATTMSPPSADGSSPIGAVPQPLPSLPPASPAVPPQSPATETGLGGGGGLLGSLLANPAVLTALPGLLENLGPLLNSLRPSSGSSSADSAVAPGATAPTGQTPIAETTVPILHVPSTTDTSPQKRSSIPPDRHTALLCAVKPYLSSERQAAADTVLRLCRIWDTLAKSGLTLGSLGAILRPLGDAMASATAQSTGTSANPPDGR